MDRVDSLPCQHPNVLGCPNHGPLARELMKLALDGNKLVGGLMATLKPLDEWPEVLAVTMEWGEEVWMYTLDIQPLP